MASKLSELQRRTLQLITNTSKLHIPHIVNNEPPVSRGPLFSPLHQNKKPSNTTMKPSLRLFAGPRKPLIKFIGKRFPPKAVDHAPHAHPASPDGSLPNSFASYRSNAQQHGPLGGKQPTSSPTATTSSDEYAAPGPPSTKGSQAYGLIGGKAGSQLGPIKPGEGEFFDRSELPRRFQKLEWSEEEMEAVMSGGASSIVPQLSYHFKR